MAPVKQFLPSQWGEGNPRPSGNSFPGRELGAESRGRQWAKLREKLAPVGILLGRWEIAIPKIKQSPMAKSPDYGRDNRN